MTNQVAIAAETESDTRWRQWQARGAEDDRRTAKRMRGLMLLVAAAYLVFAYVQLT